MLLSCLGAVVLLFLAWVAGVAVRRDLRDRDRPVHGPDGSTAARAESQGRVYLPGSAGRAGQ